MFKQSATPILEYHWQDTVFEVYVAKVAFTDTWQDEDLRQQVAAARRAYQVYSPSIPVFDAYDAKSVVYLVHASYPVQSKGHATTAHEWITLRFVPAAGEPAMSEDLKHYSVSPAVYGGDLVDLIGERLLQADRAAAVSQIFTYSRFGAVRPQAEHEADQWIVADFWQTAGIRTKNRWTAMAFALINSAFLELVQEMVAGKSWVITAQINDLMEQQVFLSQPESGKAVQQQPFPYAYQVLGLEQPSDIRLDREKYGEYFYRFPGYFFPAAELINGLCELVAAGRLAPESLEAHLDQPWSVVAHNPHYSHLQRFGELLSMPGSIPGSHLTGQELRAFLDQRVPDGVQLRLLTEQLVTERCQQLLKPDLIQKVA